MRTARSAFLPGSDTARLPDQPALTFNLPVGHYRNELLEFVFRKIGAGPLQTPSYVFAHYFLTERMNFGQAGVAEDVLVGFQKSATATERDDSTTPHNRGRFRLSGPDGEEIFSLTRNPSTG